ncbi:hypothetical protein HPP92_016099 [Vanilla planifolia]|uniref:C2H2-type domain-containing protein n=1 Tax=Vanilla planifolia TaxID=51239 RepID=A0A835USD6_VANPL|nr:hypothetical protein HPP92_016706 [Vanilla planifolia]KAG0471553.1 hypothetical protein HPP92_016099 [Vanilla planifolia]
MFRVSSSSPPPEEQPPPLPPAFSSENATIHKKKRRPAGTPDPDAEVVSLSPRTLLESDRYVCEICNQGFQRDQNLQMHRRRHKVPWKLMKRDSAAAATAAATRKRVFVCPEPSCLHHDPCHALGDLVGIKKHFRRKHSAHKQWACARCSKAYAVHSDFKAHLKTCGTRGHSCDCGRVFSRVESFIEHQDCCNASRSRPEPQQQPSSASRTASSSSPSCDTLPRGPPPPPPWPFQNPRVFQPPPYHNIELQLLPPPSANPPNAIDDGDTAAAIVATELHLSIAPPLVDDALHAADIEKAAADAAMDEARQAVELAERELAAARRVRQQAQAELEKACALRASASRQINSVLFQITCADCRQRLMLRPLQPQNVVGSPPVVHTNSIPES